MPPPLTRAVALTMAVLILSASAWAVEKPAQTAASVEYPVKAAYLYQFARFVEWPKDAPGSTGPLRICVLGRDPFGDALELATQDKRAAGRELSIHRFRSAGELAPCPVVFVAGAQNERLPEIIRRLQGSGSLLVGDSPGFAAQGGVIGFYVENNVVRFEVNLEAAEAAGIHINARLLRLARLIEPRAAEAARR